MSKHRQIDKICAVITVCSLLIIILFMTGSSLGIVQAERVMGYEKRLFDKSKVHTLDIVMDDWEDFIDTCMDEEYRSCNVVIDGEAYKNVGIRAKGNTSLSSVAQYGNDRYSFKIEFDKYADGKTYYGLDKLSLNNIIQDTTYLKDYLSYTMMENMGVSAPMCSFVFITVNGEDWGLYLAVEGVEEGFLQRNYGTDYGELYKPDSLSFGGGRGNGIDFDMTDFRDQFSETGEMDTQQMPGNFNPTGMGGGNGQQMPGNFDPSGMGGGDGQQMPGGFPQGMPGGESGTMSPADAQGMPEGFGNFSGDGGFGMGSSDVKLQYIDDDPESYSNIFENAKTEITESDKERLIASLKVLSEGENIESVVDVESVIKYLVVHNFVCNGDSYTGSMVHNYYLYEKDGVMSMIPWDYNLAFGGFSMGGGMGGGFASRGAASSGATSEVNSPIDSPVSDGDISSRPMIAWIFENEEYTELYHQYYDQLISEYFESGCFTQMVDEVVELISPYVEKDPTKFYTYEEFEKGVETIKQFCTLRAESVRGQLEGTIPSTSEGQKQDSSALIDASKISISDMGSMGSGMGGQAPPETEARGEQQTPPETEVKTERQTPPETKEQAEQQAQSETKEQTEQQTQSETKEQTAQQMEEETKGKIQEEALAETERETLAPKQQDSENMSESRQNFMAERAFGPESMQAEKQVSDKDQWIWLGISAVVLMCGILFAVKFKRR